MLYSRFSRIFAPNHRRGKLKQLDHYLHIFDGRLGEEGALRSLAKESLHEKREIRVLAESKLRSLFFWITGGLADIRFVLCPKNLLMTYTLNKIMALFGMGPMQFLSLPYT